MAISIESRLTFVNNPTRQLEIDTYFEQLKTLSLKGDHTAIARMQTLMVVVENLGFDIYPQFLDFLRAHPEISQKVLAEEPDITDKSIEVILETLDRIRENLRTN